MDALNRVLLHARFCALIDILHTYIYNLSYIYIVFMTEWPWQKPFIHIDRCNDNASPLVGISCVNLDKQYRDIHLYIYMYKCNCVCICVCVSTHSRVCLCVYVPMNGLAMWGLACPPNRTNWINHRYIDRDSLHSRWSWCCMLITFVAIRMTWISNCRWCLCFTGGMRYHVSEIINELA